MRSVKRMIWESTLVLVFLLNGTQPLTTPNVVIDGYTVNSTLSSPATLPLETTIILVCRVSGIPHELQTNYHWTCPNGPCQQTGYAGRKISDNILAINITSTSDGGTYTCNVTAEGSEASQHFDLNVTGGQVVHSYGRLILYERVITDEQQLQPPNNDSGDGRIECRVSSGQAGFSYHGRNVPIGTNGDVHQIRSGATATVVIRDRAFNSFVNFEGECAGTYHYLFLSNGTLQDVSITGTTSTDTSITVNIDTIPSGIARIIIGYRRQDLGVPVVGEYDNIGMALSRTFSSLVPGAKYRVTAWGLGGGTSDDRRRSQSPAVREVTTMEQSPSSPRDLTRTRVFDDGIELNWIPPREPNGDIQHYIIKYTPQNGTQQEINTTNNVNYYNLTGLERGQTYNNITVVAVNSAGGGGGSQPIVSYVHNPTVERTETQSMVTPITTGASVVVSTMISRQESLSTSTIAVEPTSTPIEESSIVSTAMVTSLNTPTEESQEASTTMTVPSSSPNPESLIESTTMVTSLNTATEGSPGTSTTITVQSSPPNQESLIASTTMVTSSNTATEELSIASTTMVASSNTPTEVLESQEAFTTMTVPSSSPDQESSIESTTMVTSSNTPSEEFPGTFTTMTAPSTSPTQASCPPRVPSLPLNTMVLTTLTTTVPPGTTITIGCVDGYYTDKEEILMCGSDGQWRGNITQCRETCSASNLTAISDDVAYTVPTEIRPGTVVGTHCGEGYQVAINAVCQDDRTWRVQGQCVQSTMSYNCPSINPNTAVIIAPIVVSMVILLAGITLLVIGIILIAKRKKHTHTIQYNKRSKIRVYDEVGDYEMPVITNINAEAYQELDINRMDDTSPYATSN